MRPEAKIDNNDHNNDNDNHQTPRNLFSLHNTVQLLLGVERPAAAMHAGLRKKLSRRLCRWDKKKLFLPIIDSV